MNKQEYLLAIDKEIQKADSIVILRHELPDPDAIGSQIGLKKIIEATYPNKTVYALGKMNDDLAYIGTMDTISQEVFDASLIIVNDTANTPRIDSPYEVNPSEVIKIDHHPDRDVYGKISYVDTTASSTSEILCQFVFNENSPWKVNEEVANALYAGIVGDTGRFLYPATIPITKVKIARPPVNSSEFIESPPSHF